MQKEKNKVLNKVLIDKIMHYIFAFIFIKGLRPFVLKYDGVRINLFKFLFGTSYTTNKYGVLGLVINTIVIVAFSALLALPISVLSALFLVQVAPKKLGIFFQMIVELLAAIPSIIYGLFGMLFFVEALHWGYSLLAGSFTVAIMILPLIMRTTEEALLSVPDSYREGSFGLGAGKLRTVFKIVLPSAVPGILAGVILAIGRVVGETAALIYTAGAVADYPKDLMSSTRTLAVHMYNLSNEGLHTNQAYATAVVLLVLVLLINWLSSVVAKKITKK